MAKPVAEQVVVITGASSGVGRACVQAFGARRAKVALIARNEEALKNAAEEVRQAGGEALVLPLDVANAEAVEDAAAAVEQRWGRIDTWVNDAMVTVFSPALEMKMEEYRRVTEVNYFGSVYGTMAALKRMIARDEGAVIQICSALAYRSIPLQSAYCGSKAAMRAFSDSVRTELLHAGSKVRISVLILPAVNTPQFVHCKSRMPRQPQPVPPIYQPELIARAVIYAAEHRVREMVIGGGSLKAVLGQKVAPGLLDHYLARAGYEGQMTPQPAPSGRPDDLFAPVPGDPGVHGMFDDRARSGSLQLWLRLNETLLAAAGTASLAAAAGLSAQQGRLFRGDGPLARRIRGKSTPARPRGPLAKLAAMAVAARGIRAVWGIGPARASGKKALAGTGKKALAAGVGLAPKLAAGWSARKVEAARQTLTGREDRGPGLLRRVWEDVREELPV